MAAGTKSTTSKGLPEVVSELWSMTLAYLKQETIDPLKGVGRFLLFGILGGIMLGIGVTLLAVSGLRALQTETGSRFQGHWSWAPYFIVLIGTVLVIALALSRVKRGREVRR